ncbi:MAG: type II toxin-antitoxin system VapC family toxin [Bacteroidota bacterium]
MEQYLIDTNVVSDYFTASFSTKGMSFIDKAINDIPNLSVITQIELLCWKTDLHTTALLNAFIADSNILNITPDIITQCVNLRKYKRIKTPDAIIAATAIAHNYTLITNNEKDFINIANLKILNPHKL